MKRKRRKRMRKNWKRRITPAGDINMSGFKCVFISLQPSTKPGLFGTVLFNKKV